MRETEHTSQRKSCEEVTLRHTLWGQSCISELTQSQLKETWYDGFLLPHGLKNQDLGPSASNLLTFDRDSDEPPEKNYQQYGEFSLPWSLQIQTLHPNTYY